MKLLFYISTELVNNIDMHVRIAVPSAMSIAKRSRYKDEVIGAKIDNSVFDCL